MRLLIGLLFLGVSLCSTSNLYSQDLIDGEWIIRTEKSISESVIQSSGHDDQHSSHNLFPNSKISILSEALNVYMLETEDSHLKEAQNQLDRSFGLIYTFQNQTVERRRIPNDIEYAEQWALQKIEMEKLWDETTGGNMQNGNEIVMALLDDGYDLGHSDFGNNIWINKQEIPDNNLDDDNNGFIDDVRGLNIGNGSPDHPIIDHGTQVLGILAAEGDNANGIAGVVWDAKVMLVSGVNNVGAIINGLDYTYRMRKLFNDTNGEFGANIVVNNFSGGLKNAFPSSFPSWCEMYDLLGEEGVVSVGATANQNFDLEAAGDLPTLCESSYLIIVTSTNIADQKVPSAAESLLHVDLGAPGEGIRSTNLDNTYVSENGTSYACPHVTGIIALLYSLDCTPLNQLYEENPPACASIIKDVIMASVDKNPSLSNTVTGGRINANSALLNLASMVCETPEAGELEISKVTRSGRNLIIEYNTDIFSDHKIHLFDAAGQLVASKEFVATVFGVKIQSLTLTNENLSSGIYFLSMEHENKLVTSKINLGFN